MSQIWQYRPSMNAKTSSQAFSRQEQAFRRQHFPGVTAGDWNDWRWQSRHRVRTAEDLARMLMLSARERRSLATPEAWRMPLALTPYALSLLAIENPDGPLRKTLLPDAREASLSRGEIRDPLGEEAHQVAPGLIRSYPHKVLLLASTDCACFCRYCTRARTAGKAGVLECGTDPFAKALAVLRRTPAIHDVLISGGDPLMMSNAKLERLLNSLRAIQHIQLIRIGTKIPAVLPQRVTPALVRMLRKFKPLWMSVHFTHPSELTPRAVAACRRLLDAGIPLMNQTVLLRGINDDLETMTRLNEGLLRMGVKPYYLHQGDMAPGTSHLRSTIAKGCEILHAMQGQVSGYAIPHFMIDPPGGGGKRPLPIVRKPKKMKE